MVYTLLPALRPQDPFSTVCVRVVRKWKFRGPNDNGDPQHVDFVFADHEGNAIYGEIPHQYIDNFDEQVQEGHVYQLSRFRVANAKNSYRPVEGRYMIEFTYHTRVAVPRTPPHGFPNYVYKLTAFEDLPDVVGNVTNFIDVLGLIVQVGEQELVHTSNNQDPAVTKKLILRNTRGVELNVTLWGERATQFSIDGVYDSANPRAVIVLFVGCLMKNYTARDYLSGGSACKWYFNPQVPETQEFQNSLPDDPVQIIRVPTAPDQIPQPYAPVRQEAVYLRELQEINPYEFKFTTYQCTVTIVRLAEHASWWFASCGRCGKGCNPEGSGYRCPICSCRNYKHKYKLLFIASDGTAEAEMIAFGPQAQRLVEKSVDVVMRNAGRNEQFPPDIAGIVSKKFTFAIQLSGKSFYNPDKSYIVSSVIASYGRQRTITHRVIWWDVKFT